jgi:hypothetical protein
MSHKLVGGYIDGGCIAHVYSDVPAFFANMNVLFSVCDSNTNTAFVPEGFSPNLDCIDINGRLFVRAQAVARFVEQTPFTEFSEVYLISVFSPPPIYVAGKFNTDVFDFNDSIPDEFLSIFKRCGASRFLSDGCGLNYYCEPKFAKALEEIYDD